MEKPIYSKTHIGWCLTVYEDDQKGTIRTEIKVQDGGDTLGRWYQVSNVTVPAHYNPFKIGVLPLTTCPVV